MNQVSTLHIIDTLEEFGGAEKNLVQIISRLDPAKYKPIVCCFKSGKVSEDLKNKGFDIIDFKLKRIYDLSALVRAIKLIKMIRKNEIKIIVTWFECSDFWGSIVGKIAGVPVLISMRRDMGFSLKKRHILVYRIINRFFDKIIAVSNSVKDIIVKEQKVNPDKILTIYNGVDINQNSEFNRNEIKKSLALDLDKPIVTILANLTPVKCHKVFLNAAAEIIKKSKSVQFLLVGESKNGYEKELSQFAENLGIKNNVIFSGFRSYVKEILSISDVSVLSSSSEGLSNAILEYMAAGNPVVATDVGGNRELVIDGITGFLVPAHNPDALAGAIFKLLNNQTLSKEMGIRGRERVERFFAKNVMIKNIDSLFEKLLSEKALVNY